ncbi:single-stranded DNA-binding protein [Paenibacillus sp. HN-1]|uniref:single-stranded DNA-binding protein n=1 Tax=Paenibacillus TaxID=44249 RepID=UPI001CA96985|nr:MULTISPECIES: single-stranded DNA-binding protein [Paenibacillus]MBY9079549.1 single-stranded DNA-binding protein [Paenibacillus sp. CGMCC 1.18879]MBY9083370.1 single-stranded DNA-binding protein [Paenibacillus sinensis]
MSLNQVVLIGRLTKDPELRYTPAGVAVTQFTLAVDRPFTNQGGEKEADFLPVIAWKTQAENAATYLKQGHLAAVTGRIQTRFYEKEGRRVYVTEIIAQNVQYLTPQNGNGSGQSSSGGNSGNGASRNGQSNRQGNSNRGNNSSAPSGNDWGINDDDLPF